MQGRAARERMQGRAVQLVAAPISSPCLPATLHVTIPKRGRFSCIFLARLGERHFLTWGSPPMANAGSRGAVLLLLFTVIGCALEADGMRPSQPHVASSMQDPKYKIDFHPSESPVLPSLDQEAVVMTDRDGKKFRCNIPAPESTRTVKKDKFRQNVTSTSVVAEELSPRKTPEDLLEALKDKCFRRYEGWWIYELCYKGHLRQFHLHDKKAPISTYGPDMQHGSVVYFFTLVKQPSSVPHDFRTHRKTIVQEFLLGTYDAEATAALHDHSPNVTFQKDPRSQSAAQRYHAHVYTNGTICDLTNQPRETEVRFVCSETGRALINSIKEAPSCKYTVVFHAPMLCKHPAFQEERQPWVVIDCNAVPSDVVPVKEDMASGEPPVETDTHETAVTAALPLGANENKNPLLSFPQGDPIPVLGAFTKSQDDFQVLELRKNISKENKVNEEGTKPSQLSPKIEEPTTDGRENVEPAALLEMPTSAADGGRKVEPGAPVEEPVTTAEGVEEKGERKAEVGAPVKEPVTTAEGEEEKGERKAEVGAPVEEPVTAAEVEVKAEELALPGHKREEHPKI